jgi:hypothetical protein
MRWRFRGEFQSNLFLEFGSGYSGYIFGGPMIRICLVTIKRDGLKAPLGYDTGTSRLRDETLFSFMQAWRHSQDLAIHLHDEFGTQ